MLNDIYAITGRLYAVEENTPATSEMKIVIPERLHKSPVKAIARQRVLSVSHQDGTKFLLENDQWLLLRFSGTEPVLRIFAEAESPDTAQELVCWGKQTTGLL